MTRQKWEVLKGALVMGAILLAVITFPVPLIVLGIFLLFKLISPRR